MELLTFFDGFRSIMLEQKTKCPTDGGAFSLCDLLRKNVKLFDGGFGAYIVIRNFRKPDSLEWKKHLEFDRRIIQIISFYYSDFTSTLLPLCPLIRYFRSEEHDTRLE